MIDQGPLDSYNDCRNILDFDDSDVLISNNFESLSFKDIRNTEINSNFYGQIERLSNEKLLIQNQCNSRVTEMQAQIMKLTNNLERIEASKTEIEVQLTKSQKELRMTQRSLQMKSNELENMKSEHSNKWKSLELEYVNKLSNLTSLNKSLQNQLSEEIKNNKNSQEFLSDKSNQLFLKVREKEDELAKLILNQSNLKKIINDLEIKANQFSKKVEELEQINSENVKQLDEKNQQNESLKASETKLKSLISELNRKINTLESKMFEEKHELTESKNYQNNLQAQLLDLQQTQINKEKEYNILLDKICNSNKKVKELEECLSNQNQISATYYEQLKKFENKHKIQNVDFRDQNENLCKKIAQLEETIQIQNRIIEEKNDELKSNFRNQQSREGEGAAVSNLNITLEELEKLIEEPKIQLKSPSNKSPKFVTEYYNDSNFSPSIGCIQKLNDSNRIASPNQRIIRNVKQIIRDFQERLNSMDYDRLESLERLQDQEKEIKTLKVQVRKYLTQNKVLETNNNEKQNEIESLSEEISKLRSSLSNLRTSNNKIRTNYKENVDNLKNSILRVTEESQNNIESRERYLQNISMMIKDTLQNTLSSYVDWPKVYNSQKNINKINSDSLVHESSTQTKRFDGSSKDNIALTGNLTGTFSFSNQNNNTSLTETNMKPPEQPTRIREGISDKKSENRQNNIIEEKRKLPSKKNVKHSDNKKDSYVDSAESWPALREVISNELSSLLNRYDVQRAQCRIVPNEQLGCHHLITELSTKDNIISKLLSYQNSNSFNTQGIMEPTPHNPQENIDEVTPVNNNKVVAKGIFSNQSNGQIRSSVDSKKKQKILLKNRMDNISVNPTTKRCHKLDNHKQCTNSQMNRTEKPVHTSKKATTTSTKTQDKSTGNPSTCKSGIEPTKFPVNNLCVMKQITISLPSTPPVTLKCPKIADDSLTNSSLNGQILDCRLVSLFLGTIVKLVHLQSELETNKSLTKFYKLLYHRSIDCSKLIYVNEYLESIITQPNSQSLHLDGKRKVKKFKIIVHVVLACQFMSKNVLASKLITSMELSIIHPNFVQFFNEVVNSVPNTLNADQVPVEFVESVMSDFVRFCVDHNHRHLLISKSTKKLENNIFTSSNTIVLDNLKKNINHIKTIIDSNISKEYFKIKYKSYENNLKTLIVKIKEMGQIIDDQNTLLSMREKNIVEYCKILAEKKDEISELQNSIKEKELLLTVEKSERENMKAVFSKIKGYLSRVINMCEQCLSLDIFNKEQLFEEEEMIYKDLMSEDCDDLLDFVRDGIRVALKLSCSVKSILF